MANKPKEVIVSEAKSIYASVQDVLKSGAYMYPFKVSFRPMKHHMAVSDLNSTLPSGHILLPISQGPLGSVHFPRWADHHSRPERYVVHVLLHLRAANGSYGLHQWTIGRDLGSSARAD